MTHSHEDLINILSQQIGIFDGYYEKNGNYQKTPLLVKAKLLESMGYDTSKDNKIQSYLDDLKEENLRPLKISNVLSSSNNTFLLPIRTAKLTEGNVNLSITLENGTSKRYSVHITDNNIKEDNLQVKLNDIMNGYHQITLTNNDYTQTAYLILCPEKAYLPDWIKNDHKRWGVSVQLYSLQSSKNNGIGTFTDLTKFGTNIAKQGGSMIAVNPLHAQLTEINSSAKSPYYPISKNHLNPFYLDLEKIPGYTKCKPLKKLLQNIDLQKEMAIAKNASYVDYKFVSKYFNLVTTQVFKTFLQEEKNSKEYADFMIFCQDKSHNHLDDYATYSALSQEHNTTSWFCWEKEYHNKESQAVKIFKKEHEHEILYYKFLQWQTHTQLSNSIKTLTENNLKDGLFLDLAIGTMTCGYTAWAFPKLYMNNVSVGAPADEFTTDGQKWNLAPAIPLELQKNGYQEYSNVLKNTMQYAKFLRLDHVIGLSRLFLLHKELGEKNGVYLSYPKEELMNILCLESHRNECVVVGEALGLVEDGFNRYLDYKNILSFTLMIFERWAESKLFKRPDCYTKLSVASTTNHDLPTMAGYYMGADLAYERKLGLNTHQNIMSKEIQREEDRTMIMSALSDQNLTPEFKYHNHDINMTEFTLKTQEYIAKSSSLIAMVNYHDLLSNYDPLNIPGTDKNYKNWSLKTPIDTKYAVKVMGRLSATMSTYNRHYV